jgi:hypothetical protein
MKAVMCLVGFALFFVGAVVYADMPKGAYLEGKRRRAHLSNGLQHGWKDDHWFSCTEPR